MTLPVSVTQPNQLIDLLLEQENDHALILLDADTRIIGWYMGAEKLFGYRSDEILGEKLDRLFVPEDRARGEPQLERELAITVGKAEDDRWSLRKDDSRFWANGIMTGLREPNGAVIGFCKVVRDRTDVKAQLDTYANRASALEAAQARKNLFVTTLAHELRNPLSVLANATQVLSASPDHAKVSGLLERQIGFMQKIMEDLFDAARIGAGKMKLELAPQSLRHIIDRAVETCGTPVEGHRPAVLFPPGDIVVHADATKLQQVFVNLTANALKFSPSGSPIWIKATAEGDHAVVRIEDRGPGISAEMLPHIFELFTQAAPPEAVSPGIGLGLGIVKGIVEMHGGTVHARSDGEGLGSEFIVRIPLA